MDALDPATALSDRASDNIRMIRESRNMSRHDLARLICVEVGRPGFISAPAIGNIETGRRGADGVRRRCITIDELRIFALALNRSESDLLSDRMTCCLSCGDKPPAGFTCNVCG